VPAAALAQDPPAFVTLDRVDGTSRAGADISYAYFDTSLNGGESLIPLRLNPYGQYIDPASGFGGYAQIPISYVTTSESSTSVTGIGDLEVGGIYIPKLASPNTAVVVHAGLTLPTGSTALVTESGSSANTICSVARVDDLYLGVPRGVSLRIGVSPILRSGRVFARADLAVDASFYQQRGSAQAANILRVNGAIGVDLGAVALSAEVVNLYISASNFGQDFGSNWIDSGALAARFDAAGTQPYVAVVFPLDKDSHDQPVGKFDAALTVGLAAQLR
jgi:hypothetical protein